MLGQASKASSSNKNKKQKRKGSSYKHVSGNESFLC